MWDVPKGPDKSAESADSSQSEGFGYSTEDAEQAALDAEGKARKQDALRHEVSGGGHPDFEGRTERGKRRIPRKGALSMRERRDTPRPVRPEPPVISGLPSDSTERQELLKASPEELRQELGRGLQMVVGLTDNTPFGQGELASLQAQILTLSSQVAELGKQSREQTEVVQAMLSDMSESSERLGRKDWVLVAIGAGVSLVITGLVPPLVMLKLAVAAIHDLGHLLGLGGAQQAFIGS